MRKSGIALGLTAALAFAAGAGLVWSAPGRAQAAPVSPMAVHALSPADAQIYARAFKAVRAGDFDALHGLADQVDDECLIGRQIGRAHV